MNDGKRPGAAASSTKGARVPWVLRSGLHLCLALVAGIAVPFGAFASAALISARDALESQAKRENLVAARLGAEAVEARLEGLARYVESFAGRGELAQAVGRGSDGAVRAQLRALVEGSPDVGRAFLTDPAGILRYDWPPDPAVLGQSFAFRDWFAGVTASGGTYVSEIYERAATPKELVIAVGAPLRDETGRISSYLVAQHPIETVARRLADMAPDGALALSLVDHRGRLALPAPGGRPLGLPGNAAIPPGGMGATGSVVGEGPVTGERSLIGFARVEPRGWVVLAEQPTDVVFAPARALVATIAALGVACFLVMAGVGFRALSAVRRAHVSLVRTQASKDLLTGMIVHDLRNPLTAIDGWISLARGRVPPGDDRLAATIEGAATSTRQLLELVNTLVDVMRMEDGRMPLDAARHDVAALVRTQVARHEGSATSRALSLQVEAPAEPVMADIDPGLIGRVVDNLVTNALKHTPAGGSITVGVAPSPAGDRITVKVADTGEGIPADQLPRLFEKYGRVASQSMGAAYDTGLGLVFCRLAVERHGGRISATSTPGAGSVFTLEVPRTRSPGGVPG